MEKRERTMIEELCEVEEGLKDHEVDFIESMSQRPPGYVLSENQLQWLEALWNRHVLKKFNRKSW